MTRNVWSTKRGTHLPTDDPRITLEPVDNFRIEVDMNRNYSENYFELFMCKYR